MILPVILVTLSLLGLSRTENVQNNIENLITIDPHTISTAIVENHEDHEHLKVLPPITVAPITVSTQATISYATPTITFSGAACHVMRKKKQKKEIIEELFDPEQDLKDKLQDSKVLRETTELLIQIKPTTRLAVENKISSNLEDDVNDIWHKLESDYLKEKKKEEIKKTQRKKMIQHSLKLKHKKQKQKKTKICRRLPNKHHKKEFHTIPAKKKRNECLLQQTVIIPENTIIVSSIPAPVSSIISKRIESIKERISSRVEKVIYNCITNFAGTHTTTVTQMSFIPVPTTNNLVSTSTIFAPTTQKIFEALYTPYTVTKTTTDTMYMIKVTTACRAGCNACELDANGMILPAGQLPPGIFATPVNEVDRSQYEIVGYAGMNLSSFKAEYQGYQSTHI